MAKYTGTVLTNKGKELLARAVLGETMVFTKVEIGKGILPPGTDKETLTSLIDTFKILSITSTTKLPNGGYRIRISFNNKGFIDDTYLREVGIYARGEDGIEILYSYCNTDTPNLIPNESSGIIESVEDIITYISSAATINAVIDQSNVYATIKDLVEGLATKEDKFNKNEAFNKSFGTITGTVMEGDKRATDLGGEGAFNKNSGFNKNKSDAINSNDSNTIATSKAVKTAYDRGSSGISKADTAQNSANLAQTKANEAYTLANGKEPKFNKKPGFNLEKSDSVTTNSSVILATAKAIKTVWDALTSHRNSTNNPHVVTKSQVGLGNVQNYGITDSVTDGSSGKYGSAKAVKTAYDKGTEGLNKANAALTLNQAKGLFVGKETKQYNNSSLDNDTNQDEYGWFTILKGVSDNHSPLTVTIYSGPHYSTKFVVGGSYAGQHCKVSVLFNNSILGNGTYSNLRGIRASNDGTVQVKMSPRGIVTWTIGIESSIGNTEGKHLENRLVRNDSLSSITSEVDLSNDLYECKYDVGDYWITESTTNPATKWTGSTWTKLEGRVLLGTSSGYALGSQGGTSTVALTLANIAAHTHGFSGATNTTGNHYHQGGDHRHRVDNHAHTQPAHTHSYSSYYGGNGLGGSMDKSQVAKQTGSAGGENTGGASPYTNYQNPNTSTTGNHNHTISGTTGSSGSGTAFNIMNPYRVVNIWRRTA